MGPIFGPNIILRGNAPRNFCPRALPGFRPSSPTLGAHLASGGTQHLSGGNAALGSMHLGQEVRRGVAHIANDVSRCSVCLLRPLHGGPQEVGNVRQD